MADPVMEQPQSPVYHDATSGDIFNNVAIQNEDIEQMADAVAKFRAEGLEKDLPLPKFVIAGAQNAGKSSLLQSLTGLPFPTDAKACTRFATEIILRPGTKLQVEVTFPATNHNIFGNFSQEAAIPERIDAMYEKFDAGDFQDILLKISNHLDASSTTKTTVDKVGNPSKAWFSDKILRIQATGPNYSPLSVVDTPGLYVSGNDKQLQEDIPMVENLVKRLIADTSAMIVAVMDARHDDVSQTVFNMVKAFDATGNRTIGVLTHCDAVQKGGEDFRAVSVAKNEIRPLANGWFVVKNRSAEDRINGVTLETSKEIERSFFAKIPWNDLEESRRGVDALRDALARLFAQHIRREFPILQNQMLYKLLNAREALNSLGSERATPTQQREFLSDIVTSYKSIIASCTDGTFVGTDSKCPSKIWLHAKSMESDFIKSMEVGGAQRDFKIVSEKVDLHDDTLAGRSFDAAIKLDQKLSNFSDRRNIYAWINLRLHESSEHDGIGLVPCKLISTLLKEQIEPWHALYSMYVSNLTQALKTLIQFALNKACADADVVQKLFSYLSADLNKRMAEVKTSLDERYSSEFLRISTCHPNYIKRLAELRANRFVAEMERTKLLETKDLSLGDIKYKMSSHFKQSYTRTTVFDIHDTLDAYYDTIFWSFIENVKRACERVIVGPSAALTTADDKWVRSLSDTQLAEVVGETERTKAERSALQAKINRLENAVNLAQKICPPSKFTAVQPLLIEKETTAAPISLAFQNLDISKMPNDDTKNPPRPASPTTMSRSRIAKTSPHLSAASAQQISVSPGSTSPFLLASLGPPTVQSASD